MKLKTSFCKLTTFKKDLTRFAPVWALYLIGMLLILTDLGGYGSYDRFAYYNMEELIQAFGIVNLCYALVCALMLFGDLYNTRMCYSLHTQPARRESLFLSHWVAALCFSIVPNTIAALYLMLQLEAYWFLALYWLLASSLQFLFYFGIASVSALCVGNRIGMIALYGVLNFFSMIAYWVVNTIYLPQLPGVVLNFDDFSLICPTVHLYDWSFFQFEGVEVWVEESGIYGVDGYYETFYEFAGLSSGWGYVAIMGGIGLVMSGLAVLLYRARHLESAGDFVAFRKLSPVVCLVLTVCIAVGFAFFGDAVGSGYMLWLAVGLVVGWFGSRMLIERRVKVFNGKAFLGLGILAAVLTVSFLVISFDVFGIVSFVPDKDRVESVTVSNYKNITGGYYDDYYYGNRISVTLDEEEEIEDILTAHRDILDRMQESAKETHLVTIRYKLKSGRVVVRSYSAPANGTNYEIVRKYFYTPESMMGFEDWDQYVKSMESVQVDGYEIPEEYFEEFLVALRTDCEKGAVTTNMGAAKLEIATWVYLRYEREGGGYVGRELAITTEAENTLALLKQPKYVLGFETLEDVKNFNFFYVDAIPLDEELQSGLLEALQKDAEAGNLTFGYYGSDELYMVEYAIEKGRESVYRYIGITKEAEYTIQWLKDNDLE